jgi:DNA primase large subunit
VEKRKVFLKGGWAYVPASAQSSIVFQVFQTNLEHAMEVRNCDGPDLILVLTRDQDTNKSLPKLDEDTRLVPILDNLSQGFLAGVPSQWMGASDENVSDIKAEMVDEIARKHYPLCMRNLHDNLKRDHHLKHFGRLQYGLFLKVNGTLHL